MSGDKNQKDKDLEKMKNIETSKNPELLENEQTQISEEVIEDDVDVITMQGEQPYQAKKLKKEYQIVDGYRILEKEMLPFNGGSFYPEGWQFAYRCPTTKEIANFSTIDNEDRPKIIAGIEELITKCFKIIDRVKQQEVPSNQINDGERLFFFLKLREFYMHDRPIEYVTISPYWNEAVNISFVADSLIYKTPNQKLLDNFDGRMFTFKITEEKEIKFLIPTLDISSRVFRFMLKKYQDSQKETNDNIKDADAFNKQFLFMAPYLYEKGSETVDSLRTKFLAIQKDEEVYGKYIEIINRLNLTNSEGIKYSYKGIEEESQMKFPGGWKNIFVDKETFGDMFD